MPAFGEVPEAAEGRAVRPVLPVVSARARDGLRHRAHRPRRPLLQREVGLARERLGAELNFGMVSNRKGASWMLAPVFLKIIYLF